MKRSETAMAPVRKTCVLRFEKAPVDGRWDSRARRALAEIPVFFPAWRGLVSRMRAASSELYWLSASRIATARRPPSWAAPYVEEDSRGSASSCGFGSLGFSGRAEIRHGRMGLVVSREALAFGRDRQCRPGARGGRAAGRRRDGRTRARPPPISIRTSSAAFRARACGWGCRRKSPAKRSRATAPRSSTTRSSKTSA